MLYGEPLSSLGSATIDNFPAFGRAHALPESLRPLLFEIALLRCCFRHRPAPSYFLK
jgi:hypothetical protein